jgi:hypothetical protein
MRKRFITCLLIIFSCTSVAAAYLFSAGVIRTAQPVAVTATTPARFEVVLVPLDSRPPCTQFVEQLGQLAGIHFRLPPAELLDNYKQPANRAGLRDWLKEAVRGADAAIVSTDMLIHGGLLASRVGSGLPADADEVLGLLAEIKAKNPQLKLYVFNIIPRLLIADSSPDYRYQKKMLQYSILKDEVLTFENPLDNAKFARLAGDIPPAVAERRVALYEANTQLDFRLVSMVESGVLTGLVIGQDDGWPFGLPNMVKTRLSHYVGQRPELAGRVFITRGTDEVALSVLGKLVSDTTGYRPRVFVRYSHPEAPAVVMPFMPHSVAQTVKEKIAMAGGRQVASPEEADFILFVHIGTANTGPVTLTLAARSVKELMAAGHQVAVVDLTEHFFAKETIFPYLVREGAELTKLAAYAGWNTTSNSIGTAVTQAALYTGALRSRPSDPLPLYRQQLAFLTARWLDDWYYQKDIQPKVNTRLKERRLDAYNLGDRLPQVNEWVQALMTERADDLFRRVLSDSQFAGSDGRTYVVTGLTVASQLPWQRTFEIKVEPTLDFAVIKER